MSQTGSKLIDPQVSFIVTYAPAGLGHLRVADALIEGLPKGVTPLLLGAEDKSITLLHRASSAKLLGRPAIEWLQFGFQEQLFTLVYRSYLRAAAGYLQKLLTDFLHRHAVRPRTVVVVCTHFALAHQLGAIKDELSARENVRIILVVQVTDDSPQPVWYVIGANLIIVPSDTTRSKLISYGRQWHLPPIPIEVAPYPISLQLLRSLTKAEQARRRGQFSPAKTPVITTAVPISGAAVGLPFLAGFIESLHHRSPRFSFHIMAKVAPQTAAFLAQMSRCPNVTNHTADHDRGVVASYVDLYQSEVFGFEVTKPSEQAFKALATPKQRGGAILLFADPVGEQEHNNLGFLSRHNLIPDADDQAALWQYAAAGKSLGGDEKPLWLARARHWRGLRLPPKSDMAAGFVDWCLTQGVFVAMGDYMFHPENDLHRHELATSGVTVFWEKVSQWL